MGKIEKMSGEYWGWLCFKEHAANGWVDQQLGQMYELMKAIRQRDLDISEGVPEAPKVPEKGQ